MLKDKMEMLKALGAVAGVAGAVAVGVVAWAKKEYRKIAQEAPIDVDNWSQRGDPTAMEAVQTVLIYLFARKGHKISDKPYKIVAENSKNVKGLKTTRRAKENESAVETKGKPPLIVGSMRTYCAQIVSSCGSDVLYNWSHSLCVIQSFPCVQLQAWVLGTSVLPTASYRGHSKRLV